MSITQITDLTAQTVAAMMVEDTGRHMLDSGDAYGRGWQRAQAAVGESGLTPVEFYLSRPKAYWGGWRDEVWPVIDAFHYIVDNAEYSPELQAQFEASCDEDTPWMAESERFAEQRHVGDVFPHEGVRTVNTYNHDTFLSETLQWVEFTASVEDDEGHEYESRVMLLQIHRGADVRGGYTKPRAFLLDTDYFGYESVNFGCTNPEMMTGLDGETYSTCEWSGTWYPGGEPEVYNRDGDLFSGDVIPVRSEDDTDGEPKCRRCGHAVALDVDEIPS